MKKLTKAIPLALIGIATLGAAFVLAACDDTSAHTHNWDSDYTVDKAATCTEDGSKSIHCNGCDETKDVTVVPAAHAWAEEFTIDVEAGCTTKGSKSKHCTADDCTATTEVTVVPETHKWAQEFTIDVEADCTTTGSKSKHCTVAGCDAKTDVTVIPETHAWAEEFTIDVEASCDTEGSKSRHCTVEGCDAKTDVTVIPEAHVLAEEYTIDVEPTCKDEGSKSKHCTVAGCNGKGEAVSIPVDPTAHDWQSEYTVDTDATCTVPGSESIHCNNCGASGESRDIPASGHSPTAFPETQSTCSEKGHDAYWYCEACEKYFSDAECETPLVDGPTEYELVPHTYDSIFSLEGQKAATCTTTGYKAHNVCTVCHAKFDVNDTALTTPLTDEEWAADYVLPITHTNVTKKTVKDPTCTLDGYSEVHYYCAKCKSYAWDVDFTQPMTADDVASVTISKLNHAYSEEWTVDKEATCSAAGSKSHHCTREGCTYKTGATTIDKLAHTWNETEYVIDLQPTCQDAGSKSYHCSVCGAKNEESAVEIPVSPDSHDWSSRSFILTRATCQTAGSQAVHCLLCEAQQEPTEIPVNPNAHIFATLYTVDEEATCEIAGSKSHHCTVDGCDAKADVTEIPALGHDYVWTFDGVNGTPTCTTCGAEGESFTVPEGIKDAVAQETITHIAVNNVSAGHAVLHSGTNLVNTTQAAHYLDFTADVSGTYEFSFKYLVDAATASSLNYLVGYNNAKKGTVAAAYKTIDRASARGTINSVTFDVLKGETLSMYLNANVAKNIDHYIVTVSLQNAIEDRTLSYGDNTVKITVSGDVNGVDSYTFIPDETKVYSITVPEYLTVAMGDDDLIISGTYAEFEGEKNTAITLSFSHSVVGSYEINIGDAQPRVLELGAAAITVPVNGKKTTGFRVADDLAPGRYTITLSGSFLMSRATGAGNIWFLLNGSGDYSEVPEGTAPTDNAVYASYSTVPLVTDWCVCDFNSTANGGVWKITLELAAGDELYFAPDTSLEEGATTTATLYVALSQAA